MAKRAERVVKVVYLGLRAVPRSHVLVVPAAKAVTVVPELAARVGFQAPSC